MKKEEKGIIQYIFALFLPVFGHTYRAHTSLKQINDKCFYIFARVHVFGWRYNLTDTGDKTLSVVVVVPPM